MSALQLTLTLSKPAEHRCTVDGHSVIEYAFTQASRRTPLVGTQRMGTGNAAALAASNKAHRLRPGMCVRVHAAGLERDAAGMGIRILGIDHVEAEATLSTAVAA